MEAYSLVQLCFTFTCDRIVSWSIIVIFLVISEGPVKSQVCLDIWRASGCMGEKETTLKAEELDMAIWIFQ